MDEKAKKILEGIKIRAQLICEEEIERQEKRLKKDYFSYKAILACNIAVFIIVASIGTFLMYVIVERGGLANLLTGAIVGYAIARAFGQVLEDIRLAFSLRKEIEEIRKHRQDHYDEPDIKLETKKEAVRTLN